MKCRQCQRLIEIEDIARERVNQESVPKRPLCKQCYNFNHATTRAIKAGREDDVADALEIYKDIIINKHNGDITQSGIQKKFKEMLIEKYPDLFGDVNTIDTKGTGFIKKMYSDIATEDIASTVETVMECTVTTEPEEYDEVSTVEDETEYADEWFKELIESCADVPKERRVEELYTKLLDFDLEKIIFSDKLVQRLTQVYDDMIDAKTVGMFNVTLEYEPTSYWMALYNSFYTLVS